MSYTKILLMLSAAKEAYAEGSLNNTQYLNLLNDLENGIVKIDVKQANQDFKDLIALYAK